LDETGRLSAALVPASGVGEIAIFLLQSFLQLV
jgi:hypothetical protein